MAAPSVSLLYANGLAHTVVGPWTLVQLALLLVLLLPSVFDPGRDGKGVLVSLLHVIGVWEQQGKNLNV